MRLLACFSFWPLPLATVVLAALVNPDCVTRPFRYSEAEGPAEDHHYASKIAKPFNMKQWQKRVLSEIKNLSTSLPETIWCVLCPKG
jgi:hypothetical protein